VTVAGQIGLALGNLKLSEALRVQSMRDVLTGLFNRRYMEESLERELRRAVREQGPLGVIMLDVDHFKRLNDTSGHDAGDMILRALGHCMQEITRGYDIACRYGGEEFTLILPNAPLSVAVERAEQLREKFKHLDVEHQGHSLAPGTLSLGVAGFPEHGSSMEHILRAADVALYRAKNEGRDRVVIAGAGVVARTGG
jgi:diguanylate cyclase (GGDEF)-like protein